MKWPSLALRKCVGEGRRIRQQLNVGYREIEESRNVGYKIQVRVDEGGEKGKKGREETF